jgi:glycosyltransferase involved in cell wall biosynthesis
VLHVISRLNVGGPALLVVELLRGLDPERFDVHLAAGAVDAGEADYLDLRGAQVPLVRIPGLGRSPHAGDDLRALRALVGEMRRLRPDVVHTHTAKAGALGRVAARLARVPRTVHTFHGHLLHGYFSPPGTAAVRTAERALARRTDRLVAVGARVRDDLLAAGIGQPGQYAVIAPGVAVGPPVERSAARADLGLPDEAPVVLLVARLTQVKRPDRFLAVAEDVLARRDDVVFAVLGAGPLLPELEARARPLGDRVRFLGWRADVERVYAAADVVVLTSDNEGMPVSLIEAALCGRPCVTTDVGSAAEVVADGETGLVVPASAAAVSAAVQRLLDDRPLRERLGEAARSRAGARFSPDRFVSDTAALYASLTDRGSRREPRWGTT